MKLAQRQGRRDPRGQLQNSLPRPARPEENRHEVRVRENAGARLEQPLARAFLFHHVFDRGSFLPPHPKLPLGGGGGVLKARSPDARREPGRWQAEIRA